jgi:hypothetical protein
MTAKRESERNQDSPVTVELPVRWPIVGSFTVFIHQSRHLPTRFHSRWWMSPYLYFRNRNGFMATREAIGQQLDSVGSTAALHGEGLQNIRIGTHIEFADQPAFV